MMIDSELGSPIQTSTDLSESSFDWKDFILTHPNWEDIVGAGVVSFRGEFISNTKDPNRGMQPRCDFVVYHPDGIGWQLHPGSRKSQSVKPIYLPAPSSS